MSIRAVQQALARRFPPSARRSVLMALLIADLLILAFHARVYYDWWWQMANGRHWWETHRILRTDPFTFTVRGHPYIDKYWLSEILLYPVFARWGFAGAAVIHALLLLGMGAGAWRLARRGRLDLFLLLSPPALILIEQRSSLRIYLFSYLILPAFLAEAWNQFVLRQRPSPKGVARLCALEALWTNLHTAFLWGWLITGLLGITGRARNIERRLKPLLMRSTVVAAATALVTAASLLNPYGPALVWDAVAGAFNAALRSPSVEWVGLFRLATPLTLLAWAVLLAGSAVLISRSRYRLPALSLLGLAVLMNANAYRHIGTFAIVAVCLVQLTRESPQSGGTCHLSVRRTLGIAVPLLLFFILVCSNRLFHIQRELKRFGLGPITSELPVDAASFVARVGLRGNFINDWPYGGYLIWRLWPRVLIAADGRTAPFPEELHRRLAKFYDGDISAAEELMREHDITGVFVPWNCGSTTSRLARDPFWDCLFIGPHSTVWVARPVVESRGLAHYRLTSARAHDLVIRSPQQAYREDPWLTYPTALFRRGFVLLCLGQIAAAQEQFAVLQQVAPRSPLTRRLAQLMKP
ncbi:MAG TPA: hypothetical protein EYP62_03090 [Kiritimatiellae bacterium]|nr:hypothetical protein [Kiritimatiellia bacterium]